MTNFIVQLLASEKGVAWLSGLSWVVIFGAAILSFLPGMDVQAMDLISISNSMITISAIIFGIMGAWLSLVKVEYREQIKEKVPKRENVQDILNKAENLSGIITTSCVILFICIIYNFAYYVFSNYAFFQSIKSELKGLSLSVLVFLGGIQIRLLIAIMWSGVDHVLDLYSLKDQLEDERD
ncbi:hypothetical protein [Marinomonas mediterranea]|jgi:hypothetical protein|uniref:Uncharacterized protein n=1 Tax=Marinomonas mediterranea (strain ATCC 700492 / JCM 21426 / NBRC 103028 / MMB-1) TaxID=717774 RepID=F2JW14_MARM1|nr:hypothetical protein [Marinomonas mediterranea]ADZ92902.1 hypothetical protein Marme_3691 [Marinomonas mediterranea MMB-1]WCN18924.1 hypothetical protein GV053_18695 [Marinomonas mediterranea MMB-1]